MPKTVDAAFYTTPLGDDRPTAFALRRPFTVSGTSYAVCNFAQGPSCDPLSAAPTKPHRAMPHRTMPHRAARRHMLPTPPAPTAPTAPAHTHTHTHTHTLRYIDELDELRQLLDDKVKQVQRYQEASASQGQTDALTAAAARASQVSLCVS